MRRLIAAAFICLLGTSGCYSGSEYRWSAFIGCAFYGDAESCYILGDGFPAASVAHAWDDAREVADVASDPQLAVDGLTHALHEQYLAYDAAQASALAAGLPTPSPAEFLTVLDAGRSVSREEARRFLENALGSDWIHRIEPPASAGTSSITEPL